MHRILICALVSIAMLTMLSVQAIAADLGNHGQIFKIKEEAFVEMIKRKLAEIDIDQEQQKMQNLAKERVNNPTPVAGIAPATEKRIWQYDPSYVLDKDAKLPCGTIIHRAETRVNPLEQMDLNRRLFFIDGRESEQIKWLKEQLHRPIAKLSPIIEDRIILLAGSPLQLKEELNHDVYFDQHGELTGKFGIKASPAMLEQDGKYLRIEEIKLN